MATRNHNRFGILGKTVARVGARQITRSQFPEAVETMNGTILQSYTFRNPTNNRLDCMHFILLSVSSDREPPS